MESRARSGLLAPARLPPRRTADSWRRKLINGRRNFSRCDAPVHAGCASRGEVVAETVGRPGPAARERSDTDEGEVGEVCEQAVLLHSEAMEKRREGRVDDALELLYEGVERFPENVYFLTSIGVLESRKRNFRRAEQVFRAATSVEPENATTLQAWGVMEVKRKNEEAAEDLFRNACKADPTHISAYQMWGKLEAQRGNIARARKLFRKGEHIDPGHIPILHAWGDMELRLGNVKDAQALLQRILEIDERNVQALLSLGKLQWQRKKTKAARKLFRKGIAGQNEARNKANLLNTWGVLEAKRGHYSRAKSLFQQALEEVSSHVHSLTALGSLEARNGRFERATKLYSQAASLYPRNQYVLHHLAQFYRQLGQREGAERVLKDLVRLNPDNAIGWHTLGTMAIEVGDMDQAIEFFQAGKQSSDDQGSLRCYEGLAEVFLFLGQIDRARKYFQEGSRKTSVKTGRFLRAWASMEKKTGQPEVASKLFRASTNQDPEDVTSWLQWALHEKSRGNVSLAEDCYKAGLGFNSYNSELWYGYATLCMATKEDDDCREVLDKALAACPRDGPLLMEYALMEESCGNMEAARNIFKKGSAVPISHLHPPLLEAWAMMEAAQGDEKRSKKLQQRYVDSLVARDLFLKKQKSKSFEILEHLDGE